MAMNAVLLIVLFVTMTKIDKPPLVIRYMNSNVILEENYTNALRITEFDINLFVKHFIEKINLFDSFALEKNLPEALNMMAPSFRSTYQTTAISDEILRQVVELNTRSTVTIRSISYEEKGTSIHVSLLYDKEVIAFQNKGNDVMPLRAVLVLEKLEERTKMYPYGIRVKAFQEFKVGG